MARAAPARGAFGAGVCLPTELSRVPRKIIADEHTSNFGGGEGCFVIKKREFESVRTYYSTESACLNTETSHEH